ncbi:MAG TPA: ABC transporter ATP-binding protein [bacterium]|nr:ABC transporter ATP-binding protein [bacterium]HPP02317.1 ABC transporter ATP-binding protein [bacterium]
MRSSYLAYQPRAYPALRARGICKSFGAVQANHQVDLTLRYGRIHALVGENGAGKSTLVSICAGLLAPDSGTLEIDGQTVRLRDPRDAIRRGVGLVQQHFSLIPAFTVLENILLGQEIHWGPWLQRRRAEKEVQAWLKSYGLELPWRTRVGGLPVGIQQQVEIAKVLYRQARILLFDEPTAALVSSEIDQFLETLIRLRDQGIAVLLITHRLPEVERVADTVTVLRKGQVVYHQLMNRTSLDSLATALVGESLPEEQYERPWPGAPLFECRGLLLDLPARKAPERVPIDLYVLQREIVGVAGVAGNGQEEWIDAMLGIRPPAGGKILYQEQDITSWSVARRRGAGIAYIPQDRRGRALLPQFSFAENYLLNLAAFTSGRSFRLPRQQARAVAADCAARYLIQTPSLDAPAGQLSGGHQQRLVVSREFLANPGLIIAHDPTRGLDIRAARFVRERLIQQCRQGAGMILFSSEWSELFRLCHRIAVLYRGGIVETRPAEEWTVQELGLAMAGAL